MENKRKEKLVIIISILIAAVIGLVLGFVIFKLNYGNKVLIKENKNTTGKVNSSTVDINVDLNSQIYAKKTIKMDVNNGTSNTKKICKYDLTYTPSENTLSEIFDDGKIVASGNATVEGNGVSSVNTFSDIKLSNNKIKLINGTFEVDKAYSKSTLKWEVMVKSNKDETINEKIKGTLAIEIISCEEK